MGDYNLYIWFEWAIKKMLRDKANFDILEGFISVLFGEEVKIEEIFESESSHENEQGICPCVDIKAKNKKGDDIIVELQVMRQLCYLERLPISSTNPHKRF